MAQGTAVVCADIPALREVAATRRASSRPTTVDGWIAALESLLTDAAARSRLAAAGSTARDQLLVGALRSGNGCGVPRGSSAGEDVDAGVGDEHGVLELRGAGAVGGDRGPAVVPDDGLDARPW